MKYIETNLVIGFCKQTYNTVLLILSRFNCNQIRSIEQNH